MMTSKGNKTMIYKWGILLLLVVPLFFQILRPKRFTPLNGVQLSKKEHLSDSLHYQFSWFKGSYQKYIESAIEEELEIKSPMVRLRNQFEYSLFGKINAQQIYKYKDQFFRFYVPDYNEATLFMGKEKASEKIQKLKALQAYLGNDHPIIISIAPSKTYYHSSLLPKINQKQSELSNYKFLTKEAFKNKLHLIDFNKWFLAKKTEIPYPLFGKAGIHWTSYGATLAMDSIVRYAEKIKKQKFQHPVWKIEQNYRFFYNDQDLAQLLNVFYPPNDTSVRSLHFPTQNKQKKLKALIISDSFFDVVSITGLREQIFTGDSEYLYYFNKRKDPTNNNQVINKNLLLRKMKEADCILLLNDIVNMEDFGWGFIEEAYRQLPKKK